MAPSWSKRGQHSRKLGPHSPKMGQHSPKMGQHSSKTGQHSPYIFVILPSILLYSLFIILYPQVGPWPAVGRKTFNRVQAPQKNSLYKKMRRCIFLPHVWRNIYANKKLMGPVIWEAKKFGCMWRSPFAPLGNFLNHERVFKFIKIQFGAGDGASLPCKQIPAKMNFAQPWA